ncbi:MAG: pirin family protein [Flavobacteriales bacterium]|nr:MAG: pirin family protein [Flavobacteriales bacterium]
MKAVLHKAATRGHADHGWLNSHHSFSFAAYHDPDRMHFGVLRVLNDDIVSEARGFGTHPHNNMEIISIPLEGDLQHMDSMGNSTVIKEGDLQVMSAGTGIQHSEYNKNQDRPVKFLQIWLFPNTKNVEPRYDQISLKAIATKNSFYQVLSPNRADQGVWIYQDAWFHMGNFDAGAETEYQVKQNGNGVYVFVIEGSVEINGQKLEQRDGYGLWDLDRFKFKAGSPSKVLLMEVPMTI